MQAPAWIKWTARVSASLLLILLVVLPIMGVFHSGMSWPSFSDFFDPDLLGVVQFTTKQAFLSTIGALVFGVPLGLWLRGSSEVRPLLLMPFSVPSIVVCVAWSAILPPRWSFGIAPVLLAHIFLNVPWVALLVGEGVAAVPRAQWEVAQTLGASLRKGSLSILWPYLRWPLLSSAVQVFSLCTNSFAIVLLLGGGPPVESLETRVYSQIRWGTGDFARASAAGFWQLLLACSAWSLIAWAESRSAKLSIKPDSIRPRKTRSMKFFKVLAASLWVFPYLLIFPGAISATLQNSEMWQDILGVLPSTIGLIGLSAAFCVGLSVLLLIVVSTNKRWARWIPLVLAPGGLSTAVLAIGFYAAYRGVIDPISGSLLAIAGVQSIVLLPLSFRILWPVSLNLNRRSLETALTLGASYPQAFWIAEWPRWRGPLMAALGLVACSSLGEVAASSFFSGDQVMPLAALLGRWMSQYRFEQAQVLAAVILLASALPAFWFGRLGAVQS